MGFLDSLSEKICMSSPPVFLRDSRASETRARVKITPSEKRRRKRVSSKFSCEIVLEFQKYITIRKKETPVSIFGTSKFSVC